MKKSVAFLGLLSFGLFLTANPSRAQSSFSITSGTTSAEENLGNGQTGTISIGAELKYTSGTDNTAITISGTSPTASQITVTNSGIISTGKANTNGRAIRDNSGGSNLLITNNAGALIQSAGDDTIAVNVNKTSGVTDSVVDIENKGTIQSLDGGGTGSSTVPTATGNQAINLSATTGANLVHNYSTGVIWATAADAVRPGLNGKVYNDGLIFSNAYHGSGSDGIEVEPADTNVTIINGYTETNNVATYKGAITGYAGNLTGYGPSASDVAGKQQSMIEGGRHGITGGAEVNTSLSDYDQPFTLSVTNYGGAIIQGDNGSGINIDGVDATEVVTVTNYGTISGNGVSGDGDGIDVDGILNLTNYSGATVVSKNAYDDLSEGVTVGGGTILNSGTIEGSTTGTSLYARGITLAGIDHITSNNSSGVETDYDIPIQSIYQNTTVTNYSGGLIKGDSESGIAVLGTTGGGFTVTINNNAGGTIEGNNTGVSEDTALTTGTIETGDTGKLSGGSLNQAVIELDDTGNTYVINESGTIQQDTTTTGTAIAMHGASNTLNITGGSASVIGDISGDTATDSTLNITPGAGNSFSYGYKISNFTVKINSDGTKGTVTLSGANTYSGGTTLSGGTTYINNASGSGTGTGAVAVGGAATLGGHGTIQPTGTNAVTVAAGGTLAPGGVQPAAVGNGSTNTANGSLKVDTTNFTPGTGTTPNAIMNITSANLTFALGSGDANSGSRIIVTGGVANTIALTGDNTVTINDLVGAHLTLNQEYVLIAGDNTTYTGLDFGATSSLGTEITGGLTLLATDTPGNFFSDWYGASQLYRVGDNIEVDVVPEPSTWGMMVGGLAALVFIQSRRRRLRS